MTRTAIFETMREVRIKRKGIEKQFQEGLANLFRHPRQATSPVGTRSPGNPSTRTICHWWIMTTSKSR